ncbi:MAG: sensor histidine kinase [Burkholderiales bacterium]
MNAVIILWAAVAGAALAIAALHGLLWLLDRRGLASLAVCAVAIGVAGLSITELGMMYSRSPAEYGDWVWWFHLPNFLAVVGLVAFVHLQFGTGRAWLAGAIVALRALVLGVNFFVHPNVTWSEISALSTISFLGQQVSVVASARVRWPFQLAGTVASLLFILYVADALAKAWREGDAETRRKAVIICGGILAFIVLAIGEAQLVVWSQVRMPIVVAPPFLILMAAITYELSRGIVASVRMEREAQHLRDELARVSRINTVSQLSASLAHEMRQPLTAILANAQAAQRLLEAGKIDAPELRAILDDVCAAAGRADAVLERTRALMNRSRIEFRDVSVTAVARDVLALLRTDAIQRGVTVESFVPEAIPLVRADRVQVSQVLLNLVVNAMDSVLAQSARERRVSIEARRGSDDLVEVAVVDSGTGIPGHILPRVFEAFVTSKATGLGIGLAVSRAIVQSHGGELRAENNPDGGATFKFTLHAATPRAAKQAAG